MRIPILLPVCLLILLFLCSAGTAQEIRTDVPIPKAINSVEPDYGNLVAQYGRSGVVTVYAGIDKNGKVSVLGAFGPASICSDPGSPLVDAIRDAAVNAASKSVFEVPMKDGKPTEVNMHLTYKFGQEFMEAPIDPKKPRVISVGVMNGRAKKLPKPIYPAAAGANRVGGLVSVQISISETGDVLTGAAISGHPFLRAASVEAACKAEFAPIILQGNPVKANGLLTYNFHP